MPNVVNYELILHTQPNFSEFNFEKLHKLKLISIIAFTFNLFALFSVPYKTADIVRNSCIDAWHTAVTLQSLG